MAESDLAEAGYRMGTARRAVIAELARQRCAVSAREIEDALAADGDPVGRASVFRVLEQLEALRLVRRVEVGQGVARFEPIHPGGGHHHHLVCERCERIVPFEDPKLERAIETFARREEGFEITDHDVTLRGVCAACRS